MKKNQIIINLEKELFCSFKLVDLNEIEGYKDKETFLYSDDESSNITGIAICNNLFKIPKTIINNSDNLKDLTNINLSYNKISDISSLKQLTNIQFLDLESNQIEDISSLRESKNLQKLFLSDNRINDISALNSLEKLQVLHLSNNHINDISQLKDLINIQTLNLKENQINDISSLKALKRINSLNLNANKIRILPNWIIDFPKTKIIWEGSWNEGFITFDNNPIENPPIGILRQGDAAIRKYFEEIKKEQHQYNFEVKLMLIGEGGTGKTSLLKKLLDKNAELPDAADTTLGIDIQKWNYPLNKTLFGHLTDLKQDNMLVNIWDLGGQKIYHGTHQIFFGENTFYILVEETREHKTDFSYWLNTLEQLAGEDANLVIVINEKFGHVFKFDVDGFKSRFNFIKELLNLDLSKKDERIVKLQELIKHHIQHLNNVGQILPASYIRVKEELFKTNKNYIGFDKFNEICNNQGITNIDSIKILSKYLHETGIITHFIDDDILRNRVFLNSEWLIKTIYKVLDNIIIKEKKGRISNNDVYNIWNPENLGFEIGNLTQLMNKFGLMYKVKNKDEYVIPAHLPTEKPYSLWSHHNHTNLLMFKYEFGKYMPEGLMSHLIVSLHNYIENQENVWHRGVNLIYDKTFAEIIETYGEINTFEIRISGSQKREMLTIIRHSFSEIIKPFKKLYFKELIPCNCKTCAGKNKPFFFSYENLRKRLENNKPANCDESMEDVDVRKLIDDVILEERENNVVLEKAYQQQLLDLLIEKKFFMKNELIATYDSEKKFALQEQIGELERRISELNKRII
jgi:Leucine-rich repeat (LRR) protein